MPAGVSAYTALANVTLGSSATTVTFSSISQAYRDLVLVITPIVSAAGNSILMQFNSDTGANYSRVTMSGNGSTTSSFSNNGLTSISPTVVGVDNTSTISITSIFDYSVSDKHKSVLIRSDASSYGTGAAAHRWANTSAITSIVFTTNATSISAGSTFALYGVSA
jgi:hypothetical protein